VPVSNPPAALGRPRADVTAAVFAATLRTVHELGYANATMDRIAAAAGIAKTTIYRRWPSKGALIADCILDAFEPVPLDGATADEVLASGVRFVVAKLGEPGVGAAFAGVFVDGMSDPALREILSTRLQDPFKIRLADVLDLPEDRVLLVIDVLVGTLLHRMGMTGAPMVESDVTALTAMIVTLLH
jgi:AcrR family transcriptional regulator